MLEANAYESIGYGLRISSPWPLPAPAERLGDAATGLPGTSILRVTAAELSTVWEQPGESLQSLRTAEGQEWFSVRRGMAGYQFLPRHYGRHLVALDGSTITSEIDATPRPHIERFLAAHGLPLAAILRGYDALHASAVTDGGGVVAFTGPSGAGKTTMAQRLILRGARFVADDVLILEPVGDGLVVHPSLPFMAVRPDEIQPGLPDVTALGPIRGASDKLHYHPPSELKVLPLKALYHLEADADIAIRPLRDTDARNVLSLAFLPFVMSAERLTGVLEVARRLDLQVAQFRLTAPRSGVTEDLLARLEDHIATVAA